MSSTLLNAAVPMVKTAQLDASRRMLVIKWEDSQTSYYPYVWLRDNDPAGFHPDTQERHFNLTSIDVDDEINELVLSQNQLQLTWQNEGYQAQFDLAWLYRNQPGKRQTDIALNHAQLWRCELGASGISRYDAKSILSQDHLFLSWLRDTQAFGLAIVEGIDNRAEAGLEIAQKVGFLRETNFGVEFEVKSKPNPNNLAYTAIALPLHTDLTNQELPPGYQFLHCVVNDAEGGESNFCDGFAVAEDLRRQDPTAFDILVKTQVPFRFHDEAYDIRSRKAVINLDDHGQVKEVCFNPHLADTLDIPPDDMLAYYRAYQTFMKMTQSAAYSLTLKLKAGEMVVFDNRRVLHGREGFDPQTGSRYLRGCYVDRGEFESCIRVLSR